MFLSFKLGVPHIPKTLQGGNKTHAVEKASRKRVETYEDFGLDRGSCVKIIIVSGYLYDSFCGAGNGQFSCPTKTRPKISQPALNPDTFPKKRPQRLLTRANSTLILGSFSPETSGGQPLLSGRIYQNSFLNQEGYDA